MTCAADAAEGREPKFWAVEGRRPKFWDAGAAGVRRRCVSPKLYTC